MALVAVPPGVDTTTSAGPAACTGAIAVMDVAELTVKDVAAVPPNATLVAPVRNVPVIVTDVPPASGPDVGLRAVMVGAAMYVN